jgi:hypothetical protein
MTVVQIRGKSIGRRSKVTTGRKAFVEIRDGRSPWARRWSDLIFAHASDPQIQNKSAFWSAGMRGMTPASG